MADSGYANAKPMITVVVCGSIRVAKSIQEKRWMSLSGEK